MRTEFVHDWMTTHLVVVTPETSFAEAERIMRQRMIRRLPVVENGRLIGILTFGDVRKARPSEATSLTVWEIKEQLNKLKVKDVMTYHPITIAPESSVGEAAQLMLQHKIGGLVVVNHLNQLVGIITESDIFRLVVKDWAKQNAESSEPFAHYS